MEAISLSLDGSDAARHDALRRIDGCFDRTLVAARACAAVGLPFQVNTLVSEETLDDLPAIYGLATELRAARWSLFFLVAVGRGAVLKPITAEACEELLERLLDLGDGGGAGRGPVITTTEAPHFRRVVLERARRAGRGEAALPQGHLGHGAGIRDGNGIMFISHTGEVYPSGFFPLAAGDARIADPVVLYRDSDLVPSAAPPGSSHRSLRALRVRRVMRRLTGPCLRGDRRPSGRGSPLPLRAGSLKQMPQWGLPRPTSPAGGTEARASPSRPSAVQPPDSPERFRGLPASRSPSDWWYTTCSPLIYSLHVHADEQRRA